MSVQRNAVRVAILLASVLVTPLWMAPLHAYQAGGNVATSVQTGFSGLTTTLTRSNSSAVEIEPGSAMNSGRDWSVDFTTYNPDIRGQRGLQWVASGTNCSMPSAGATTGPCPKGSITFTFSRPVANPRFHIHDFGGRMEANCKLAIQGTLALASASPASVTFTKLSGGITVSGTSISGRASTAPMTESNHSSGSVQINGIVRSLTFNFSVILTRQGTTCSYDNATMLMSAAERLNATFSYGEDMGDGATTYDGSSPASHIIGDLRMGATALSAEAASTINSATAPITVSPVASINATGDNDDAISGTPVAANIGQDYSIVVPLTGTSQNGQVCGFIDMNNSGTYTITNPNERTCTSFASGATSATLTWFASQWPDGASAVTATGLRLRAAYGTNVIAPNGPVDSGEVEDYRIELMAADPPLAIPLESTGTQGASQTVTPATSQGQFVASRTCIVSGANCVSTLQVPGEGTYTVNGDGTIAFVPVAGFNGPATQIGYRIEDSQGRQSTSTVSLRVIAAPSATNDSSTTTYNTPSTVAVIDNDTAADGATLIPTSVRLCGTGQTLPNCNETAVSVDGEGTYTVNQTTGEITFTPLSTFAGTSRIDYQVSDSAGGKDSARLSFDVAVPIGTDALPTTSVGATDTNQTVAFNAVAANGTTLDPLKTCIVVAADCVRTLQVPNVGTYSINTDGTVTFDPLPSFTGVAPSQTYRVEDRFGTTAQSTLTFSVVPVPTAAADTSSGNYNTAQTVNLLANDSAGAEATLSSSTLRLCNPTTSPAQTPNTCTVTAGTAISVPNVGTYVVSSSGVLTFTPVASFVGIAPSLSYQVQDSFGQYASSTFTATVSAPPPPTAIADTSIGAQGAAQTALLLANDSTSATGQTLSVNSIRLCSSGQTVPNCSATSLSVSGEGTYSVNGTTGEITFTPLSSFVGTATPVSYQVTSNTLQTTASSYTPTVVGTPTASNDVGTAPWNADQTFNPILNDTAASGASLQPVPIGICTSGTAAASCTSTTLTVNGQGTYTLNNVTGIVTFDPLPSFTGTATPIQYAISDSIGQKAVATITPSVSPPPAPVATSQERLVVPGGTSSFTTITGAGGLALSGGAAFSTSATCLLNTTVTPSTCGTTLSVLGEGAYSLDTSTGVVTFTAEPNASPGTKTPVTYRVTDETGQTATSTLTPVIPSPPVGVDDTSYGEQNKEQVVNILGNDTTSAVTYLSASSVKLCPTNATSPFTSTNCNLTSVTVADQGRYTLNSDGTVSFVPCTLVGSTACPSNTVFTGQVSPARYIVADSMGQLTSALVSPVVLPPPATGATGDTGSAAFGQPIVFTPLDNDTPGTLAGLLDAGYTSVGTASLVPSSVRLCASGETPPNCTASTLVTASGTYVVNQLSGAITFTPATNFSGTPPTSPTYVVCNQMSGTWSPLTPSSSCAAASITATIAPPISPVIVNDVSSGDYNSAQVINVLANDTTDPLLAFNPSSVKLCGSGQVSPNCTLSLLTVAGEGTYSVSSSTGVVTFTPLPSFIGTVSSPVRYQVTDSFGATASAMISPTVTAPPMPRASPEVKSVLPGSTVAFTNAIGNSGLAVGTGLQTGTLAGPCLVDPSDLVCKSTFAVAGEGVWSINRLSGIAQFVADSSIVAGETTPVEYRVTDAVGQTASAELTAIIPQPAALISDVSVNAVDVNHVIAVLANDVPGGGTSLVPSSLALCLANQVVPFCSATSIVIPNEGTYSVSMNGTVLFDPLPSFTGQATPVSYQVLDSLGRAYSTSISPRVTTTPPTALSDSVTLEVGSQATFRPIFGTDGLVSPVSGGPALRVDTACLVDPVYNVCELSATIEGEGTYVLDPSTGVVTYTPIPGSPTGTRTPVMYLITDSDGFIANGMLTPTVLAPQENNLQPPNPELVSSDPSTSPAQKIETSRSKTSKKARASDRTNWARPSTPVYFNPLALSRPSRGAKFDSSLTRLWDEKLSRWSVEVETADGRWTLIRNTVRFIPREGFTGQTTVQFRIVDSSGETARAMLTAVIDENATMLPETGIQISKIVFIALFMVLLGGALELARRRACVARCRCLV